MADSWQEIDGDGVLMDWENPKPGHAWHYLEAIRRAYLERCEVTGMIDVYPFGILANKIQKTSSVRLICKAIDELLVGMLSVYETGHVTYNGFANHTDSNGDWHNKGKIPMWTDESLFAYLEEPRIESKKMDNMASWIKQQYKIINLLKWVKKSPYTYDSVVLEKQEGLSDGYGNATAQAAYNNAIALMSGWFSDTATDMHSRESILYYPNTELPPFYQCSLRRKRHTITFNNTKSIDCVYDFYGMMYNIYGWIFYPAITGSQDGKYFKLLNGIDLPSGGSKSDTITFDIMPFIGVGDYSEGYDDSVKYGENGQVAIMKFDGPNGFKFRGEDW